MKRYTVGPQVYMRTVPGTSGRKSSTRRVSVLKMRILGEPPGRGLGVPRAWATRRSCAGRAIYIVPFRAGGAGGPSRRPPQSRAPPAIMSFSPAYLPTAIPLSHAAARRSADSVGRLAGRLTRAPGAVRARLLAMLRLVLARLLAVCCLAAVLALFPPVRRGVRWGALSAGGPRRHLEFAAGGKALGALLQPADPVRMRIYELLHNALGLMIGDPAEQLTRAITDRRLMQRERQRPLIVGLGAQDAPDRAIDARRDRRICVGQPLAQRAARHDLRRAHLRKAVLLLHLGRAIRQGDRYLNARAFIFQHGVQRVYHVGFQACHVCLTRSAPFRRSVHSAYPARCPFDKARRRLGPPRTPRAHSVPARLSPALSGMATHGIIGGAAPRSAPSRVDATRQPGRRGHRPSICWPSRGKA